MMANVSLQNFIRVWKFIISRIVMKMNVEREDLVEREYCGEIDNLYMAKKKIIFFSLFIFSTKKKYFF